MLKLSLQISLKATFLKLHNKKLILLDVSNNLKRSRSSSSLCQERANIADLMKYKIGYLYFSYLLFKSANTKLRSVCF